nr:hypothetical protein MACL_00003080 [Theileria orientalis]
MNKYRLIQSLFIFLALFYDRNLVESKNENNSINAHLENYAKKNINRPLKFVELCIKKRKETDEFHYHEDDESKTGVYIAKRGFLFNSVRLNRPWYMCIFKHCKIWEAEDDRTLANMVVNRDKPEKGKLLIELNRTREDKKETELKEDNAKQNQVSEDIKNNLVKSGGNTKSELVTKMQNKLEKAKKDIDIDINSKKSNEFYRYSYDPFQEVDSYECKNNYKIKLVRKGTHDLWQNEEDIDAVCVDIYHDNRNRRSSSDESDDNDISIPKKLVVIVYFEGGFKSLTVKNDPENKKNKSNNTEEVHTTKRDDKIGKSKDSKFEGFDVDVEIPYVDEEVGEENLEKYNFYDVSQKI